MPKDIQINGPRRQYTCHHLLVDAAVGGKALACWGIEVELGVLAAPAA
jgi:hypothetical protein